MTSLHVLKDIVWILTSDVMEGQTVKMDQMNRKVIYGLYSYIHIALLEYFRHV